MIKVLHFIDSMNWGGAETLVLNTVELLNEDEEYQNFIMTLTGGPLEERAIELAEYYSVESNKNSLFSNTKRIRKLFQLIKPDIIHSHLLPSTLFSRLNILSKSKLVSTYHSKLHCKENEYYSLKHFWADKLTFRSKYYTIYVSKAVRKCIAVPLGITSKHKVLTNFAHHNFKITTPRQSNSQIKIVAIGQLTLPKNFSLAIAALSRVKELGIALDIYGTGPLKDELLEQVSRLDASVTLKGNKEITSDLLSQYDAFLMTSTHEGMPISLIEALRSGIPCILSNIPELVETAGSSAIYFDVNNLEDIVQKLIKINNQPNLLKQLRRNSRKVSKQYEPKEFIKQLKSIYISQLQSSN